MPTTLRRWSDPGRYQNALEQRSARAIIVAPRDPSETSLRCHAKRYEGEGNEIAFDEHYRNNFCVLPHGF